MSRDREPSNLASALAEVVCACGDRPALCWTGRVLTYAEFISRVEDKASIYDAMGIGTKDIVGIVGDNPLEFLTDVFALLRLKAFCVLLGSDFTAWELDRLSHTIRLTHVLATVAIEGWHSDVLRGRVLTQLHGKSESMVSGPLLGFLTSGTTGHQRVAVRSERSLLAEAQAMRREFRLTPGQRLATLVPLHHSFGFGDCALTGILAGVEVHSCPRLHPSAYLAELANHAIDIVALVPPQLRLLAEACREPSFQRMSVLCAGAPLDARTAQLAVERLGCGVGQVYGTSETGVIAVASPSRATHRSVGVPSHHVELRLDPLPHASVPVVTTDAEGIITVRTEALFEGYAALDGIDRTPLRSGWFSTGDCGRLVDGRIELTGRLSSAINVAGVKVSPEEIEMALLEFPTVHAALVSGVDDALTHQRIRARVTPADVDLEQLRRFCEARLSATKQPHYYEAVAALATTPSGKVIRDQRDRTSAER